MAQQLLAAPVCASWCLLAPPLPMQSLEKQEAPGRHHPAADSVPILKEPSGRYLSGEETCVGTSSMPVFVLHRSMTSLKSWAAAFLAEEALFCALLTQQRLIPPPKLHSALVHTSCWACPAVSLLFVLWVLAEFPLSWFSWTLSLTKKSPFQASQS